MTSSDPSDADQSDSWWPRVQPGEGRAVALSFAWMFLILFGFFTIRPVRETLSSIVGTAELQRLFLASFVAMLVAVPAYSALVAFLPRRWLVRVVYHFFAGCLLAFWALMGNDSPSVEIWTARSLFVFINVVALFSTSVFWSVLADLFGSSQGKRLFGLITSGGTAGAIVGSLLTSQIASYLPTRMLLFVPVVSFELGLWCAWRLETQAESIRAADPDRKAETDESGDRPTGGGLLAGITHVMKSPYLALICVFLFFVQSCGSQLYFTQAEIVNEAIETTEQRTQLFAYVDLGTQLATLFLQVCVSGLILRRLGVSVALACLPVVYMIGFATLAFHPTLGILVVTVIAARAGAYGITVPSREVLFTVVPREDKYKSKSFIDTVVLRGGDALSAQIFGVLRGLGLSLGTVNFLALPFTAVWALVAWRLGQSQRKKAEAFDG